MHAPGVTFVIPFDELPILQHSTHKHALTMYLNRARMRMTGCRVCRAGLPPKANRTSHSRISLLYQPTGGHALLPLPPNATFAYTPPPAPSQVCMQDTAAAGRARGGGRARAGGGGRKSTLDDACWSCDDEIIVTTEKAPAPSGAARSLEDVDTGSQFKVGFGGWRGGGSLSS